MSSAVLVADLGGTKCRFAVVTARGKIVGLCEAKTSTDKQRFLATAVRKLRSARRHEKAKKLTPVAIGVGTAGVIATDHLSIRHAPNLPIAGAPFAKYLQRKLHLPAVLVNDGRASAMGEYLVSNQSMMRLSICLSRQ